LITSLPNVVYYRGYVNDHLLLEVKDGVSNPLFEIRKWLLQDFKV